MELSCKSGEKQVAVTPPKTFLTGINTGDRFNVLLSISRADPRGLCKEDLFSNVADYLELYFFKLFLFSVLLSGVDVEGE